MSVLKVEDFPDDLHQDARELAVKQRESLRALVIRAVQREVEHSSKSKEQ